MRWIDYYNYERIDFSQTKPFECECIKLVPHKQHNHALQAPKLWEWKIFSGSEKRKKILNKKWFVINLSHVKKKPFEKKEVKVTSILLSLINWMAILSKLQSIKAKFIRNQAIKPFLLEVCIRFFSSVCLKQNLSQNSIDLKSNPNICVTEIDWIRWFESKIELLFSKII